MSNASNTFREELLDLLFLNEALTGVGNAGGLLPSSVAGNFYVRLCTDAAAVDKDTLGTECAYTGYVAGGVAVPRTAAGFSRTDNEVSNVAEVAFGACTADTEDITYAELWMDNVNSTEPFRVGWMEFVAPKTVEAGVTPRFAAGELKFTME